MGARPHASGCKLKYAQVSRNTANTPRASELQDASRVPPWATATPADNQAPSVRSSAGLHLRAQPWWSMCPAGPALVVVGCEVINTTSPLSLPGVTHTWETAKVRLTLPLPLPVPPVPHCQLHVCQSCCQHRCQYHCQPRRQSRSQSRCQCRCQSSLCDGASPVRLSLARARISLPVPLSVLSPMPVLHVSNDLVLLFLYT